MLPTIDLDQFSEAEDAIAQQMDAACRTSGFFYLQGHSLPHEALADLLAQSQQFFHLPSAVKAAAAWNGVSSNQGYGHLGQEQLDPSRPYDAKETFNIGREAIASGPDNPLWPQGLPHFRAVAENCFTALAGVAQQIMQGLAIALHLPRSFFLDRHDQHPFTLRLLHYPPQLTPAATGQLRAGEHTDYGTITLLAQDACGGLEIQTLAGDWIPVPYRPNTLVVNLGDLLARWTNLTYRSTPHRVGWPKGDRPSTSRYAIAFFCDANPEVDVACLPSCQTALNPPRFPPIRAGDYLQSRLMATYQTAPALEKTP